MKHLLSEVIASQLIEVCLSTYVMISYSIFVLLKHIGEYDPENNPM